MAYLEKFFIKRPTKKNEEELKEFAFQFLKEGNTEILEKANNPEYLYWEDLKWKSWLPKNKEGAWYLIKMMRKFRKSFTTIKPHDGKKTEVFTWGNLPRFQNFLHEFDLGIGGDIVVNKKINEEEKKYIIRKSIIEEAIASSQIEGAHTSRKVAKEMIKLDRKPKDHGEQMIYNNYKAMQKITKCKDEKLSIDLILELHEILTTDDKNLEKNEIGQFRKDKVSVIDELYGYNYHDAPDPEFVQQELKKLIHFANQDFNEHENYFIHPIIEAIMLHFWIAYLHPFIDGNGRLARCLFYWYMLKNGYWIISYLPISRIIKKDYKHYGMSFVYSEQDDYDLTYFIDYNIRIIQRAKKEFEEYLVNKIEKVEKEVKISKGLDLNNRQIQILRNLYQNGYTTATECISIFEISKPTAIIDLKDLEEKGLVTSKKIGRQVRYYSKEDKTKGKV